MGKFAPEQKVTGKKLTGGWKTPPSVYMVNISLHTDEATSISLSLKLKFGIGESRKMKFIIVCKLIGIKMQYCPELIFLSESLFFAHGAGKIYNQKDLMIYLQITSAAGCTTIGKLVHWTFKFLPCP